MRNMFPNHTAQMNVIEDDQAVQKLSAITSDPATRPFQEFRETMGWVADRRSDTGLDRVSFRPNPMPCLFVLS